MKKSLALILALVMLVGMLPVTARASESEDTANLWSGRSAVFVGDSITAGAGTTKTYYQYLEESLGFASVTAMGVNGSCISAASDYGQGNQPLINRYQNIPSADLIVIFMGTNDYGHETPLGTAEDTQDGTFYGALNTIIPALVAKHTSSKIVFVTSLHRYGAGTSKILGTKFTYDTLPNGVGASLGDYVNALKAVCAQNGVSVIDLHTECTLDPSDSEVRDAYMPDGIHPNAAGHEVIAGIMEPHIRSYEPVESEPVVLPEMIQGNKFAAGNNQPCRASSRINYYLKAGTIITLRNPDAMQWACAKTSNESSTNNLGYFPDSGWSDKETAVVAEDGWVGFTFKYRDETQSFDFTKPLSEYITIEEPHTHDYTTVVTAPTCTEQGYTTYTCECGESYVDDYVDATGHSYSAGLCTVCGEDTEAADLMHIICYGQSFSVGADAPGYADPIVDGTFVLGSIMGSTVGDVLQPLQMTSGAQHPIVSAVNSLSQMLTADGIDVDIIAGSYGSGGRTIAQLMSAERQAQIKAEEGYTYDILSSGKYTVFQNSVAAVADYATTNSQRVSCPIIVFLQGETDQNTDTQLGYPENSARAGYGAGGDKEKYKEYMTRLKEDMQREVMEAYGQKEKPLFLIYQVSGTYVRTQYSSINMAQLEFAQENDDVILLQTPYFTPHYTNSHHLTVNGYRWLGEYIGQSMYTALTKQAKTWPILPQEFTVEDGSTLRITVSGAVNGLTIDNWTVEDATNSNNLYGFYFMVNGLRVVPRTVTVNGNDIILTVPDGSVPLNKAESVYIYYGGQGAKGTGNIRDNCSKTGFYYYLDDSADAGSANNQEVSHSALDENRDSLIGQPYPLYNWLASFCYEIEIPDTEQKQAAFYHWEMQEAGLVSVSEDQNELTLLQGSVENGVLVSVQYSMEETVVLYHNRPWAIEWKAAGNGNSYGGGMLLAAADGSGSKAGALYLPADSRGFVAWNVSSEGRNYGIKLGTEGIDTREEHIYRIENRIAADGTNTVFLIVDGVEIGNMNTSYSTSDGSLNDDITNWANGADIYLSHMGKPTSFLLKNMKLFYLKIWEGEQHIHAYESTVTAPTCTEQGYTTYTCTCGDSYVDDYVDATGHSYQNGICTGCGEKIPSFAGKAASVLSHSMSTYAGVSNSTTANSTIGNNDVYYTEGRHGVYQKDTWWQQVIDALGMELLVNNSWSGSCVFMPRKGEASVGYGDRAVNLHNDRTGEEPDVIFVYLGCNDFAYYKDTFGKAADVDYTTLILENADGTFSYSVPQTTCEAYAIMLHKVENRYPDAQIYCMTSTARRETDYTGDSYPDAGQPTEYSAELQAVAAHFGYPVIDLENAIPKDTELFDKYMGDKRAHANTLGMDQITNEVLSVMLGGDAEIRHVTSGDGTVAEQAVLLGGSYCADVEFPEGYSVVVTMGGEDITAEVYNDGKISVEEVTGDITVSAVITRQPMRFSWEPVNGELVSVGRDENPLNKLAGTITDGLLKDGRYKLAKPVVLKHDRPWELEWSCAENWRGVVLSSDAAPAKEMTYISRVNGGQLCFGTWTGTQYNNYGLDMSDLDNQTHTYRLENRIAADGSNMVWLYVDDVEIGPMNNYFIGSKVQGTTSDWVSGKDFVFSYIGIENHALRNCALDYLSVTECVHTYEDGACTLCGKEANPLAGKTTSILGASISTFAGTSNGAAADTTNSTIRSNAKYYPHSVVTDVELNDTWWMQVCSDLDLRLLVNNSWSGSSLLYERGGTVGAYVDRCVQLHDDTGENAGEVPDIIGIQMGTNDFQYYKDTLGTADIDYKTLITENGDGTYTYAAPATSLEAAAIVLHKISVRYPNAEVYYLNISQRVDDTDELIRSFNAELKQVVEHFDAHIVDIYGSAITMADFDTYIGDGRVHPNKLGMDAYTEAFKRALLGNTACEVGAHTVSLQLDGVTADYGDDKIVVNGSGYTVNLTVAAEMGLDVSVTMGGSDITADAYANGTVAIESVSDDVTITAKSVYEPKDYRWAFDGTELVSVSGGNTLTKNAGTTTDGVFSKTRYALADAVILLHDLPWVVEWKCEGTFLNANGSSGARIFTSDDVNANYNARYIFKSNTNGIVAMGEKTTSGSQNYGIALGDYDIDWTALHTYRLENRIAADGSNMVYLLVDGTEIGPMTGYYIGTKDQNTTSDWLSGKDFVFPYMGTDTHGFTNASIEYIRVFEGGHTHGYSSVVTDPTCTEQGYTTYTCTCGDSYVDTYVDATGHDYEGGICTGCGKNEPFSSMLIRYDDHLDMAGKTVEIIDAGSPTSYQVGYGVAEGALDSAVVTLEGDTLVATGIGTAKVRIDGQLYEVTVTAAPISLILLAGQSNMQGSEGNANQSIVCQDGVVYSTYGDRYTMTTSNATNFAPSALTGSGSALNVNGTTTNLSDWPVYLLNEAGAGKAGPDSGFAYEWVKQTDEKVWIVNAAHGGTNITAWQDGGTQYEECVLLFQACQETLRKEISAGHYTLSHMGYFWCQGCTNYSNTAQWYVEKYLAMHNNFKTELAFDHDSNPSTADKVFEFGGIIPVRAGHENYTSYRQGVYTDTTTAKYHESFKDLRFTGPRVAQYWMINNPELTDIWGVCNIGENWVTMPNGTDGVSKYFRTHYENGTVDYTTQVKQSTSWYTPTTPAAVHDSIHYNQIGYNEVGRESVRNTLIMLGEIEAPEVETTVELLTWDGYTRADEIAASIVGNSGTLVVPKVYPLWNAKEITYELSDGLTWSHYDLLAETAETEGTLTVSGKEYSVAVIKSEPGSHYADHLSQLPEKVCSGLNLWALLDHDKDYYASGIGWGTHSSGNVYSVTIPVDPGDRIYATSFGAADVNGNGSSNGIRVTFFGEYGVIVSMTATEVYQEFSKYGYLTAPDGTTAVNVPMWNNADENEIYMLNLPHDSGSDICSICGKSSHTHAWSDWETVTEPSVDSPGLKQRSCTCGKVETQEVLGFWQTSTAGDHLRQLPETFCSATNLWTVLEHDSNYFIPSRGDWGNHSSRDVPSLSIPLTPGNKLFATSFGAADINGHGSANGIRVTFFGLDGVIKTMGPADTYAEFTANGGYLIAPEGTVAVNIPMWGDEDTHEIYILNREHSYANGICTVCGVEHPNLANFEGKVISILSASTSTFAGYIPEADGFNLAHRARYPQDNLLTDVNETWWMQVINELDAKLGINDSWAGSQVLNSQDTNSGDLGPDAAMASLTRIQNLGANGTPDVIFFFGGGNDMGRGVALGSFDPETAPTEVDLTTAKWSSFADAYVAAIMRLQHFYPDTEIVAMTTYPMPSYVTEAKLDKYGPVVKAICEYYGVKYVDMRNCGVTFDMLPDKIHPNAEGMDYITADVLNAVLNDLEMEAGENTVYTVTHQLTNAHSALHYYKGVSYGCPFVTALSGENLSVTVTMGGEDVTDSCYHNGVVSISKVTGDLVITAKGTFTADGHLQRLPEKLCAGINLWTALQPENIYYTASGWGNTTAGTTWSITFPVKEGDRIWATSLGATPANGSTANGVRVTWFDENDVLVSLDRSVVYQEFAKYGYITAPEGAVALNLPMTDNQEHYAVYVLSAEHSYSDDVCTVCGKQFSNPELEGHLQQLSNGACAGMNIWEALEPENTYYLGDKWGLYASAPNVHSVTFPVYEGERIWATSFQSAADKGYSGDGTRITWFNRDGVLESVAREKVYAEFVTNGYITVPEGAIAVNLPMTSKADTWEIYILNREHSYQNGACTICGAEHPNLANFEGKVVSILGDSISTFAGYIPVADGFNLEHLARYPQDDLLTDVNETWWMQVISKLDAKLGINDSWRGATVSGAVPVTTGTTGENAAMGNLTRVQNLGANGTPDVILFYGGTNDLAHVSKVGSFDPDTAPAAVDLTTKKWDNLADGYVHTLLRLRHYYPDAAIVAMLPTYTKSYYSTDKLVQANAVLAQICEHYGVTCLDLRDCGLSTSDLPDGIHPDAIGMDYITDAVLDTLLAECEVEPGENIVHSVKHELTAAESSLSYYKGVSHGKSLVTAITGENLAVTITMGGEDITSTCWENGKVSILEVTGDVVIIAVGEEKPVYADYLQQLPEGICAGTNLWPQLEHDSVYYTVNGWGSHSSGKVYSVTVPIAPGDQLWATSFQSAGANGGSINGIRLTWFGADGFVRSLSANETYAEFSANGYLTAPDGAVAVNVVMWNGDDSNKFHILSLPHSYDAVVTAPTCTEQGYTTNTCDCGDSCVDDYVDALGHCFGNWTEVTAPACNAQGQDKRTCACGHAEYRDTRISGSAERLQVSNPLDADYFAGKTIVCIGDSITNGYGVEKGTEDYVTLLGETLGANMVNRGSNGVVLSTDGSRTCAFSKLDDLPADTAVVTILLGINDFSAAYSGAEKSYYDLGTFGTDDTSTIYGASKMWCERIAELQATDGYEHIRFVFATPVICSWNVSVTSKRDWDQNKTNVFGHTLRQYCTAIMEVCADYGIPVLDLNMYSGMYYHSEEDNNVDYFGGDGVHPGANGHAMMADAFVEFLLEGYTYEERVVAGCGHSYEATVAQPSCTEAGYTNYRCPECHYSYESDYTKAAGHSYKASVTAPTCTELGYTTYTCSTCGDSFVDTYVDALGHNCSAGLCTVCGEDSVTATLDGKVLTLTGELAEGTRILVACYDGDGRFDNVRILIWQGSTVAEEIPLGEKVKLFFVDENWSPLRQFIPLR